MKIKVTQKQRKILNQILVKKKKLNLKVNNIKPNTNTLFNKNNKDYSRESNREYNKNKEENNFNNKEDNIKKNKEDNKVKEDNTKIKEDNIAIKEDNITIKEDNKENNKEDSKDDNKKNNIEYNLDNDVKNNTINNLEINIENKLKNKFIKEAYKENNKVNSFRESIKIQEEKYPNRTIFSSNNQKDKNNRIRNIMESLPLLTVGNKDKNYEDITKQNLSSSSFEKNDKEKNKNVVVITDNSYKLKNNYDHKNMKKIYLELENDKKGCKYVSLSLPKNQKEQPVINITKKKKGINDNGKYSLVNSLINEFRAKFFSKAHSPEIKYDITNDILDIPKKVTQAFGRTTYSFYYKKDVIGRAKANQNINNFGYNGPKRGYKFKNK